MLLKKLVLSIALCSSFSASALEVLSAKLDSTGENILVKVKHGGGCGEHKYKLVMKGCAESMPVQCRATIQHTTQDFCEALLVREAKFNLKDYGLLTSYYKDAKITIAGDQNSQATLSLSKGTSTGSTTSLPGSQVRCMTHTGSILEIGTKLVSLTTTNNETSQFRIINVESLVLESYPSIFQNTVFLDDGRSITTNFRDGSKNGSGFFNRVDGSTSPKFNCISK